MADLGLNMTDSITRISQIDDWFFEIKMIRALKSKNYGDPYSAIANLTANGHQMFIDSHLSNTNENLAKDDFMTIYKFCQQLGMKHIGYDRIKNGCRSSKLVDILENQMPTPNIRLVR